METEDVFNGKCIANYVAAMVLVAEMDDVAFRKMREYIEKAEEEGGVYAVDSIPGKLDFFEFKALEDCVNMRAFALANRGYLPYENGTWRPRLFAPGDFVEARETFRKFLAGRYSGKDWWITSLTANQLFGFDLWEKDGREKKTSTESRPAPLPVEQTDGEEEQNADPGEVLERLEKDSPATKRLMHLFDLERQ